MYKIKNKNVFNNNIGEFFGLEVQSNIKIFNLFICRGDKILKKKKTLHTWRTIKINVWSNNGLIINTQVYILFIL